MDVSCQSCKEMSPSAAFLTQLPGPEVLWGACPAECRVPVGGRAALEEPLPMPHPRTSSTCTPTTQGNTLAVVSLKKNS